DLIDIAGEHDQIDIAPRRRLRLAIGDQGERRLARFEIDGGIVAFPDDVLDRAPRPRRLFLELLMKSPDLEVVASAVGSIQTGLAALLDAQAELRLEARGGF